MSPKAKKHRRDIIKRDSTSAESRPDIPIPQAVTAVKTPPKTTFTEEATRSFFQDVKWIGLTTLIIVALLIIAFYTVPR